jgi:hypothetical protein
MLLSFVSKYKVLAAVIVLFLAFSARLSCQDFITKWKFPSATTNINFNALTVGAVNYTWSASPSGNSGSGSFTMTSPNAVSITGLNIIAGDEVLLSMSPSNLRRFYMDWNGHRQYLFDVTQ